MATSTIPSLLPSVVERGVICWTRTLYHKGRRTCYLPHPQNELPAPKISPIKTAKFAKVFSHERFQLYGRAQSAPLRAYARKWVGRMLTVPILAGQPRFCQPDSHLVLSNITGRYHALQRLEVAVDLLHHLFRGCLDINTVQRIRYTVEPSNTRTVGKINKVCHVMSV